MNLKSQKRLASQILKCGRTKIWIDSEKSDKVKHAITRKDVRGLIKDKLMKKLPDKKLSRISTRKNLLQKLKGRQKGAGSRKGASGVRAGKKEHWLKIVRPQRSLLRQLKKDEKISSLNYRKVYRLIKGNMFRSKHHLILYLYDHKLSDVDVKEFEEKRKEAKQRILEKRKSEIRRIKQKLIKKAVNEKNDKENKK